MRSSALRTGLFAALSALASGCAGGVPPDEALVRARKAGGEFADLGPGSAADKWQKAAEAYYRPADRDYFEDMDAIGATDRPGASPLRLGAEEVKGRNAWVIWTGGNEAWWDWLARNGYGSIDLLKLIDSEGRETRFARTGLVNEPGTRPPTPEETQESFGVRYARPIKEPKPGQAAHVEYRGDREGWKPPDPKVYGYPTGVVGLRLFPNEEFLDDEAAKQSWGDGKRFYSDPAYASRPDTVRPFRVGMSCGFCHIAPHPLKPPADPESPEWANLSNNVGNQFMRMRASFGNTLKPDNYLYHVYDAMLPGAVDTSGYPSDNNNNPNTVNSFYGLRGRVERAGNTPKELIGHDSIQYIRDYVDRGAPNPSHLPRVLFDGSDSVGVHTALSRVYLNIGTHHQQWVRTINPLLGFHEQSPFKLKDVAENSLYWHAIRIRVGPLASFFLAATDPMRLKDIELPGEEGARDKARKELLQKHLRGTGLPWHAAASGDGEGAAKGDGPPIVGGPGDYAAGRQAFARGCIACHSSVQPGDLVDLERKLVPGEGLERLPALGELPPADWSGTRGEWESLTSTALEGRRRLRLTTEDRARLARGDGQLPPAYAEWAREAVKHREFWEHASRVWGPNGDPVMGENGAQKYVTIHNYLSIDERLPVTIPRTNSGRATATNSVHGHVWEDFASQTYKELGAVGSFAFRDALSGAEKNYVPPKGGPGYYRVPTLISIWATSPLFHNNALGAFNNDPSVAGRLASFDDSIERLLWPDKRRAPSEQAYWPGDGAATRVYDAWYPGKAAARPADDPKRPTPGDRLAAAGRREADGGWVWRTTEESWLMFNAPHVPMLVGGVVGLAPEQMRLVAWAPALALLVLGTVLLLSGPFVALQERIERKFPWLGWALGPIQWALALGGFALAAASVYLVNRFWPVVELLDIGSGGFIWGLRAQAFLIPVFLFGSVGLLFFLRRLPAGRARTLVPRLAGLACLVLAVFATVGIGRTLSGTGASVKIGPVPEGVPVNIIANIDPVAPKEKRFAALKALTNFFVDHHENALSETSDEAKAKRRAEFEEKVAPVLLVASKCPDFVLDRGHDYAFIRDFTDQEKRELIALLKTF